MTNSKSGSLLANLLMLIIVLALCLLAGELFLRTFFKESIVLFPRYHTDAHYGDFILRRLRPNTVFTHTSIDGNWEFRINSQGFRNDRDFSYEKSADTLRILSLGDSHTEGFEARQEYTFSAVIGNYLNGKGLTTEVINAGVSGFSTAEQLVFLENEGIKYQPDVVVLGFYANDFSDNVKAGLFSLEDGELVVKKYKHVPGIDILNIINDRAVLRWASENSYLYSFTLNGVWNFAKGVLKSKTETRLQTEYAIPTEEVDDYKQALAVKLIERIYRFCQEHGIKLVILDIPLSSKGENIVSSFPITILPLVNENSDVFIYSQTALDEYRDVAELRIPRGHRHISEFTHIIYGVDVARWIIDDNAETISRIQPALEIQP